MGLGFWIRSPRSEIRKKPVLVPGSKGKKKHQIPDPGSATLPFGEFPSQLLRRAFCSAHQFFGRISLLCSPVFAWNLLPVSSGFHKLYLTSCCCIHQFSSEPRARRFSVFSPRYSYVQHKHSMQYGMGNTPCGRYIYTLVSMPSIS